MNFSGELSGVVDRGVSWRNTLPVHSFLLARESRRNLCKSPWGENST
ncbi:hypothetical protein CA85_39170 [Allorhodopirellula solitaria]|uniref:Uncharacterized protein n=1 Tax=Allorhodopirellula solitaria TaxID=2527987 RepID=A0A5C5X9Z0_9BACT|nr:hypothetical protein CA85_39170 [Allorhodopirellula solitaria]